MKGPTSVWQVMTTMENRGPIQNFTPVIFGGRNECGKAHTVFCCADYWTLLYVVKALSSSMKKGRSRLPVGCLKMDNADIFISATEDTQLLFLSVDPIDEPMSGKDMYLMNTAEESGQAMEDDKKERFLEV